MAKSSTIFVCGSCGYESQKWLGKCPACNEWNTMYEEKIIKDNKVGRERVSNNTKPVKLAEIEVNLGQRFDTGLSELNRVLGGGLTKGSLVLVGGDPGIGKSTLVLQMCNSIKIDGNVLYISGEESGSQVKMRAERLEAMNSNILFLGETDVNVIEENLATEEPSLMIIDSIQTMYDPDITSAAGSIGQVRAVTARLMEFAKKRGITTLIIGHLTKEGAIAGPRVLEHMVDTVLYLEGERHFSYRILRAVKNRFGSTDEIGIFEMHDKGMIEVNDPSKMLISENRDMPGSVIVASIEGTRPMLVEIQALVSTTPFGMPRRMGKGIDYNRLTLLSAVLEKKLGMALYNQDIYINVVGGLRIDEPAIDLGVMLAIVSSFKNKSIRKNGIIIGEVGLTGEIRAVSQIEKRINEAAKTGFEYVVVPEMNHKNLKNVSKKEEIEIIAGNNIKDIISEILDRN